MNIFNNQRGQVSTIVVILVIAILLVSAIGYVSIRYVQSRNAGRQDQQQGEQGPPQPVYEDQIGDIAFAMVSSLDRGSVLQSGTTYQQNITTTERFIQVTVTAQNKGKQNTDGFVWDVGNIIDSEGRVFPPDNVRAYFFLPRPDLCGSVLKPEFTPTPCVRIYEVSKASTGLKVEIINKLVRGGKTVLDLDL